MSIRIIHYGGGKEALLEKIQSIALQLKNHEYKDDCDEEEWEDAVDAIAKGNFSRSELADTVLGITINDHFEPISEDDGIICYEELSHKTSGRLAQLLRIFINGRNFSTGNSREGAELTCGYLTPDEVSEFLTLIKAYSLSNKTLDENEKDFVDMLIAMFSTLVEKKSGDLFTIG